MVGYLYSSTAQRSSRYYRMELGGGISCSYGIRALPAESLVSESGRTLSILCTRNYLQSMGQRAGPPMGGIKRRLHAELRYAVLDTSLNQYILAPRDNIMKQMVSLVHHSRISHRASPHGPLIGVPRILVLWLMAGLCDKS